MKIRGVISQILKNYKVIIVKIYLGIFLDQLGAVWGQFSFFVSACTPCQGL